MTCSTYRWARGSCSGARTFKRGHVPLELELLDRREGVVGRSRPARRHVEHVVHVGDVPAHLGLHPRKRSVRPSVSTHANAAACPEMRTSYGVMPHAYTRARSKQFYPLAPITAAGAPPVVWIPVMVPVSAMRGAAAGSTSQM